MDTTTPAGDPPAIASATVRKLNRNPRLVFDYLKMTADTLNHSKPDTSNVRTN